jgi:hypothetical protein
VLLLADAFTFIYQPRTPTAPCYLKFPIFPQKHSATLVTHGWSDDFNELALIIDTQLGPYAYRSRPRLRPTQFIEIYPRLSMAPGHKSL